MNRLTLASETGAGSWSEGFGYDTFGNRWVTSPTGLPALTSETPQGQNWYLTKNQISGWGYDGAGNLTSISGLTRSYSYDAENRLVSAGVNGSTTTYAYDGDGRRVQKVAPAGTTVYVYDASGDLAVEYSTAASSASGVEYITTDHLGSTRLVTDASGNATKCYDYLPYGEEIPNGYGGRTASCFGAASYPSSPDAVSQKFTGKERDAETGLDFFGARYFGAAQGRFTSPDEPFAGQSPGNPQSWNMYAYVLNNPVLITDPTGREPCVKGINPFNGNICTEVVLKESSPTKVKVKRSAEEGVGVAMELYNMLFGLLNYTPAGLMYKELAGKPGVEELQPRNTDEYRGMQQIRLSSQFMMLGELTIPADIEAASLSIARGHAFRKHGSQFTRFGVENEQQFQSLIKDVIENAKGTNVKNLSGGRSAYWDDGRGMVVIHDPSTPDKGTAFIPDRGRAYFDGLR